MVKKTEGTLAARPGTPELEAPRQRATRRRFVGAAALAGLPFLAAATPASADDGAFVALHPDGPDRNLLQPTGDYKALVLREASGGSPLRSLLEVQDSSGAQLLSFARSGNAQTRFSRPTPSHSGTSFNWEVADNISFNGTTDPTMHWGWNNGGPGGNPVVRSEPYFMDVLEADYNDGNNRLFERYFETRTTGGALVRPMFTQVRRDATTREAAVINTHFYAPFRVWAGVTGPGGPGSSNSDVRCFYSDRNVTRVYGDSTGNAALDLKADGSRQAQLSLTRGENTVALLRTSGDSNLELVCFGKPREWWEGVNGNAAICKSLNVKDASAVLTLGLANTYANTKGLVVRSKAGQSRSLIEAQGPSSEFLSGIDKNGYFLTQKNTSPADADLSAGQMALWFDQSSGSARLMVKAKDANGNVRTGQVSLS